MSTRKFQSQFESVLHILSVSVSFGARAVGAVLVGGLFTFYTVAALLATRAEFVQGNFVDALIGATLLFPLALASTVATLYILSGEVDF